RHHHTRGGGGPPVAQRPLLAHPPPGQRRAGHDLGPHRRRQLARTIAGTVVDHDHLVHGGSAQHGPQARPDPARLVPRRDHHGDRHSYVLARLERRRPPPPPRQPRHRDGPRHRLYEGEQPHQSPPPPWFGPLDGKPVGGRSRTPASGLIASRLRHACTVALPQANTPPSEHPPDGF